MSYKILAKYIKDLKFEIPNTETYFEFTKEIAKYKINIDIKSKEIKKKIIEVETCLHLKPHEKDTGRLKSNISQKILLLKYLEILDLKKSNFYVATYNKKQECS